MGVDEIMRRVKSDLLLGRLELGELGFTEASISDDISLLDEGGLGLDSVDALDLVVGAELLFQVKFGEISRDRITQICTTVRDFSEHVHRLQAVDAA